MPTRTRILTAALPILALAACADTPDELRTAHAALEAYCEIDVEGTGVVDLETDYLPHVIACENGNADFAALQMQAVSARSYAYYRLDTGDGTIADGTSDQVYGCSRAPSELHYEAAASTRGIVLQYHGVNIAGFFVAGAIPSQDDCVAVDGDNDYSNTERFITYNWGLAGDAIVQTSLGWVNPANLKNRGCMSQNGSDCLSEAGWTWQDIARFYYGMDIELVQTRGACVGEVDPEPWCAALDEAFAANLLDRGCDGYHEADTLNRSGWASLLGRGLQLEASEVYTQCALPYVDVSPDASYARAAATLAALTYGDGAAPLGPGPTLGPYGVPDHCEAATMIAEAFNLAPHSSDVDYTDWAAIPEPCRGAVAALVAHGVLVEGGAFAPSARTATWEAAEWVLNALPIATVVPPADDAFTDPTCHGAPVACEPVGIARCHDSGSVTYCEASEGGTAWSAPYLCETGTSCIEGECLMDTSGEDVGVDAGADTGGAADADTGVPVGPDAGANPDGGADSAESVPLYSTATSTTGACAVVPGDRATAPLWLFGVAMWIRLRRRAKVRRSVP